MADNLGAGPLVLETQAAAALLGLSPRTLEGMRVRRTGPPFVKLGPGRGARVAYRLEDLKEWIGSMVRTSTSEDVTDVG